MSVASDEYHLDDYGVCRSPGCALNNQDRWDSVNVTTDLRNGNGTLIRQDRDTVTLDPEDPFESVITTMVETNRRKRLDYAVDGSPFSNFDDTSNNLGLDGFSSSDSALFNILQKIARLRSLRKNGRLNDPANEAVEDTYLDLAVYAVIAFAIYRYPSGKV
jgi:hypothetical protein